MDSSHSGKYVTASVFAGHETSLYGSYEAMFPGIPGNPIEMNDEH